MGSLHAAKREVVPKPLRLSPPYPRGIHITLSTPHHARRFSLQGPFRIGPKRNPATQNQIPASPQRKIITRKPAGAEQMLIKRKPTPAVKPLPGAMGRRRKVFTEVHKKIRVDDKVDRVGEGLRKIQNWQQERRLAAEGGSGRKAAEKTVEVKSPVVKGAGVKKEVKVVGRKADKEEGRKVERRSVDLGLSQGH